MLAICNLCSHKRSQAKIISENVTSHLLRLSKSEDPIINTCAIRAICVLCANKATRLRLVKEGVVPVIVSQARAGEGRGAVSVPLCLWCTVMLVLYRYACVVPLCLWRVCEGVCM